VPKADGTVTTIGELNAGDIILDDSGAPTEVTHLHPVEIPERASRLVFDDGAESLLMLRRIADEEAAVRVQGVRGLLSGLQGTYSA